MERSQSCTNFGDAKNNNNNGNNNTNSIITHSHSNNNINTNNPNAFCLLKTLELRQSQFQQMQEARSASAEQLKTLQTLRRKKLQRQQTATTTPADYGDEVDYAADHEQEADDEEEDECGAHEVAQPQQAQGQAQAVSTTLAISAAGSKKRVRFQKYKQQNQNAAAATATSAATSSFTTNSSGSSSACTTRSSSSASLRTTATASNAIAAITAPPTQVLLRQLVHEDSFDSLLSTMDRSPPLARRRSNNFGALQRDNSQQSDSSRYSSVDSLLESRKPDPEEILINLGFGPLGTENVLSRIPKRFLKPSQLRGIDTDAFLRRVQLANVLADHSVLGYRGLTGNPDMPPSRIVAKIMRRFEVNERKKSLGSIENGIQ